MNDPALGEAFDVVKALQLEGYLNTTDYAADPEYIPSEFALSFVTFIKLINGAGGEENKTPIVHYHMLDTIVGNKRKILNVCHRGMAKTTVMGEYLFLYIGVYGEIPGFGKINLALYVSDSIENGVKNMRKNLEYRYENSDFLQEYVPNVRFTDIRWEFINADGGIFIVKGYGAKTGVRGAKELGTRPQLAILDDLVSDEDARSATVIAAIDATVGKAIRYALHPKKSLTIWSGTPFNARDPLYKAIGSGSWVVNAFPICEKFPCTRAEFRGSWPDRFPYEYVKQEYDDAVLDGKVSDFNQELMLRIMSDEDRLIRDADIRWFRRELILEHKPRFNFYITTDFATSANTAADYSVIIVWALNNNGDWFLIDGVCRRQTMDVNVNDLFRLAQEYQPQSVGIEVSGQQAGFIPWIQEQMLVRNNYFSLASESNNGNPGIRPNTDKMKRFNVVVPWFKAGKMRFPLELKDTPLLTEAVNELSLAAPGGFRSKNDDVIDNISQLPLLNAWRPSQQGSGSTDESGVWAMDDADSDDESLSSYIV